MIELSFLLQNQGAGMVNLIFFVGIIAVMYFFFLRPQVKKQKEQNAFLNDLKKGDDVVTGSGIIGKINKVESNCITLQLDQKSFIKVLPTAISKEATESYFKKPEEK